MRRIIVAELLSGAALHFFCEGSSLLIDCFTAGPFPVPEETMRQIDTGEGKFRSVLLRFSTAAPGYEGKMMTEGTENGCKRLQMDAGPFSVTSFAVDGFSPCLIAVDGYSALVYGQAPAEMISRTAPLFSRADALFLSAEAMASAGGIRAVLDVGARSVFVCRFPEDAGQLERELTRKAARLARKEIRLHLMQNTPCGFLL